MIIILILIILGGICLYTLSKSLCSKGGFHNYESNGNHGWTQEEFQCTKCGKIKLEEI